MDDRKMLINELKFQLESKEVQEDHYPIQLSVTHAEQIIELLKAKDPRVMTLEEFLNLPKDTPVFIEEDNGDCGWNVFYEIDEEYDVCFCGFQSRPFFYPSKSYGICWRCWTFRPTEEQREATPWETPKEG